MQGYLSPLVMLTGKASVAIYATDSGLFHYFMLQLSLTTTPHFQPYRVHLSMELSWQA